MNPDKKLNTGHFVFQRLMNLLLAGVLIPAHFHNKKARISPGLGITGSPSRIRSLQSKPPVSPCVTSPSDS